MSTASERALLELYGIALEEYRFTVNLNWKRTRYYLVLNAAILAAGAGLFGTSTDPRSSLLLVAVFLVGILTSTLGAKASARGHEYYRRATYKKTLIENELGLLEPLPGYDDEAANLAVATTRGMAESKEILRDRSAYVARPLRKGSITRRLQILL